jgi:signal transduction histidine kinase
MSAEAARLAEALALTVLRALPHPVAIVDPAQRLIFVNPAFPVSIGVDPGLLVPGMPVAEAIRLLAFRGAYGPGDPEAQAAAVLRIDRSRASTRRASTHDGRIMELASVPLPDAGWATCAVDISRLVQAEAQATASARRLEQVLAALHGGVALFDGAQRIALHNRAYAELCGLDERMLRGGATLAELLDYQRANGEFAAQGAEENYVATLRADRTQYRVSQRERPNGTVLRFHSRPIPEGGFVVEVDDVTALKRAEDEARRRAALLDGVVETLPHGVCVYGADRRVTMVNAAYRRIMEGSPVAIGEQLEEVVRRRVAEGEIAPDDVPLVMRRQLGASAEGDEAWRVLPNGTAVASRVARLPDGGHVSVVTDVTALHRAQQEARHRAAVLERLLDNIRHGICYYDAAHRIIASNAMAAALTGASPELVCPGRTLAEVVQAQLARGEFGTGPEAEARAAMLLGRDRSVPSRYVRTRGDGSVLEVTSDPTPDGGFVVTYNDVTEDRRIRAELEAARAAAEAGSQAKSRFLATMSHELRTPLNAVIGFAEALVADPAADPATVAEFARAIHEAGRHLLSLIDDVLDIARAGTGEFGFAEAPVDVAALVEGAVRVMQAAAAAGGVALQAEVAPELPRLLADERRLRQVLLNLLSNAVKFTPRGGSVALAVGLDAAGDLVARVADTGIGMKPEDIPRAFEPFTQLDAALSRRFQGSGLGLPLARVLAEGQGGTLAIESAPGRGTTVTLRMPRARLLAPATRLQGNANP